MSQTIALLNMKGGVGKTTLNSMSMLLRSPVGPIGVQKQEP